MVPGFAIFFIFIGKYNCEDSFKSYNLLMKIIFSGIEAAILLYVYSYYRELEDGPNPVTNKVWKYKFPAKVR